MNIDTYKALLALVICMVISSTAVRADQRDRLEQLMEQSANQMLSSPSINSVSMGIYLDETEYTAHFGELEKGKKNPPNDDTIYEIGSVSKTFAGALAARAVVEGKLKLTDQAVKFLGEAYDNLALGDSEVTLSHLLTHTAGLPNILPKALADTIADFTNVETPTRMNEIIAGYSKEAFLNDLATLKLDTEPGADYSYSSTGTELVAHILESIYAQNYQSILNEFVKDLGMSHTGLTLTDTGAQQLAPGYHLSNDQIAPAMEKLPWGASGNIKSTVPDMLRFLEFQLNRSNAVARESHRVLYEAPDSEIKMAYQWNVFQHPELGSALIHHGGVPRAQNYLLVAPEVGLGIFIITNQSGPNTGDVLRDAINTLIKVVNTEEI